jgi:hypothetical protein
MANSGSKDGLPFATSGGQAKTPKSSSGSADFVAKKAGDFDTSGPTYDPVPMNRPQPAMKAQAGLPNAESIPSDMGGKILKADPGAASKAGKAGGLASGGVQGVNKTPFKNLKG